MPGILLDGPDRGGQLRLNLAEIGRQLPDRPGEDVEVVVAVEFQLREQLGDRRERVPLEATGATRRRAAGP